MNDNHLCINCAKATNNGCPWSKSLTPVDGWKVKHHKIVIEQNGRVYEHDRVCVMWCPLFDRDAFYGVKRAKRKQEKLKARDIPINYLEVLYHRRDYDMVMPFGEFCERTKDAEFQRRIL